MTAAQQLDLLRPALDAELGQWFTPAWLARRMVEWADILPGQRVLEPSAGSGSLVRPLIDAGAIVTAVDVDPRWCAYLREQFPTIEVIEADFLTWNPTARFDLAVMNPDLDDGMGTVHLAHALTIVPHAVSLLRAHDLCGQERYRFWTEKARLDGEARCSKRPIFGGGGGSTEFICVDVRRPGAGQVTFRSEWWT